VYTYQRVPEKVFYPCARLPFTPTAAAAARARAAAGGGAIKKKNAAGGGGAVFFKGHLSIKQESY
jgi:hypothetical protein